MTFTDIVANICRDLNLRGDETLVRVGNRVNHGYRKIMRGLGMNVYSRTEVDITLAEDTQDQLYDYDDPVLGRIVALYWAPTPTADQPTPKPVMLDEMTYEEMKEVIPTTDRPRKWCKVRVGANWTQFKVDTTAGNSDGTVTIEGEEIPSQLEGDAEPQFDENFHEMLIDYGKAGEFARMKTAEGRAAAKDCMDTFDTALGELRLKQTLMAGGVIKQGKHATYRNPLARRGVPAEPNTF